MSMQKIRSRKFNENEATTIVKKQEAYKGVTGSGKTLNKLKFASWNVNGIRSVLSKYAMRDFIAKYNPDFICVNQTKINAEMYAKQKIKIKEYNDYWNFCKCSAGYSGVAIFAKYIPISIFQDMEEPQYSQEGRVLTLQYQLFYLVAVYVPTAGMKKPGQSQLQRLHYKTQKFEKAFHRHCQKLKQKGKGVIVCGDFNTSLEQIDIHVTPNTHKQPGYTSQERLSFKSFLNKGWIDTFRKLNPNKREYTWWRLEHNNRIKNIGKRLDYFLINTDFFKYVKKSEVLGQVMGSDHCPILLEINLAQQVMKNQIKQIKKPQSLQKMEQPESVKSREEKEEQKSKTENQNSEKPQNEATSNQNEKQMIV